MVGESEKLIDIDKGSSYVERGSIKLWKSEFFVVTKGREIVSLTSELKPFVGEIPWIGMSQLNTSSSFSENARDESMGQVSRAPIVVWEKGDFQVAIRSYRRGGFLRYFISKTFFLCPWNDFGPDFKLSNRDGCSNYINFGASRCYRELEMLSYLYGYGAPVPEPLGVRLVFRGFRIYNAWLCTRYIPEARSIMQVARMYDGREGELYNLSVQVGRAAKKILELGVSHADFHPGNVLLCPNGNIVVLDFDKAHKFIPSKDDNLEQANRLMKRWARSVAKYELSDELNKGLKEGLFE